MSEEKHIHRGWFMVFLCSVLICINFGIGYNVISVFNIPVCESTGITRQQFGYFYTAMTICQVMFSLNAGRIIRRFGVINVMRTGALIFIADTFYTAFISRPSDILISGFIYGIPMITEGFLCLSMIVSNWFSEKRGIATGIVFMSSGLGSVFLIPLSNRWIENLGWQQARLIEAFLSLVMIPIVFVLLKEKPSDVGLKPYGKARSGAASPVLNDDWGYERKELCTLPGAWLFALFLAGNYMITSTGTTVVPYLRDIGWESGKAAVIQSVNMFSLAAWRMSSGILCDRFGVKRTASVFVCASPLLLLGLVLVEKLTPAIAFVVLGYGISMSVSSVILSLVIGETFGRKNYSSVYGLFASAGSALNAISPLIYGKIYNTTGSYLPSYRLYILLSAIGIVSFFVSTRITPKKQV